MRDWSHAFDWSSTKVISKDANQNTRRWKEAAFIISNPTIDNNTAFRRIHDSWHPMLRKYGLSSRKTLLENTPGQPDHNPPQPMPGLTDLLERVAEVRPGDSYNPSIPEHFNFHLLNVPSRSSTQIPIDAGDDTNQVYEPLRRSTRMRRRPERYQ
jgi:hypothetical protein